MGQVFECDESDGIEYTTCVTCLKSLGSGFPFICGGYDWNKR